MASHVHMDKFPTRRHRLGQVFYQQTEPMDHQSHPKKIIDIKDHDRKEKEISNKFSIMNLFFQQLTEQAERLLLLPALEQIWVEKSCGFFPMILLTDWSLTKHSSLLNRGTTAVWRTDGSIGLSFVDTEPHPVRTAFPVTCLSWAGRLTATTLLLKFNGVCNFNRAMSCWDMPLKDDIFVSREKEKNK